jgi:hypothetical protein
MGLSIGPISLDPADIIDFVGDVAGKAAPIVMPFNPALGIALSTGSKAADVAENFLEKAAMDQTASLQDPEMRRRSAGKDRDCGREVRDHRGECERTRDCDDAGSGGGVFRELALLLGKAMGKTAEELRSAAKQLGTTETGSAEFFKLNADVTALSQQLSFQSNNATNAIKSFGEAATTLVKK